ncbi:MAG: GspH/FimT family pseudopilin [Herbaspirillum sp.]
MSQIFRRCSDASRLPPNVQLAAHRRFCGFTLIELMVTLAVAAVLMAVAAPSFRNITISNKLTTTANDVVGAINVARMEAIRLNASTQFCSDLSANNVNGTEVLGLACTTQAGAVWGMVPNAAGAPTATLLRAGTNGIAAPVALTGHMAAIRFGSNGLGHAVSASTPFDGLVADISSDALSTNKHRCIRMAAGSIVTTTTQTGAC